MKRIIFLIILKYFKTLLYFIIIVICFSFICTLFKLASVVLFFFIASENIFYAFNSLTFILMGLKKIPRIEF